jgi:hypothetical protein
MSRFATILAMTSNIRWDDDDICFLYYNSTLALIIIVLAHWNNSLQVDLLIYSDTLSRFQRNQVLLLLHNVVCWAREGATIHLIVFGLNDMGSNQRSTAIETSTLTIYSIDAVY